MNVELIRTLHSQFPYLLYYMYMVLRRMRVKDNSYEMSEIVGKQDRGVSAGIDTWDLC